MPTPVGLVTVTVALPIPREQSIVCEGAAGAVLVAAVPDPAVLVQPFTVWVTVYVPAVFTVIEFVVAALLHSRVPVTPVAVSVDVPSQLLTTVTPGAAGAVLGAAVPDPAALVQPLRV